MSHIYNKIVDNYDGSLEELSNSIGNLHYEYLTEFLKLLSEKIYEDAKSDTKNGRLKLGKELYNLSSKLRDSYEISYKIWRICKPHMK